MRDQQLILAKTRPVMCDGQIDQNNTVLDSQGLYAEVKYWQESV